MDTKPQSPIKPTRSTDMSAPETRVLRCQPGDVVILHYRDNVPSQMQMQAAGQLSSVLPDGVQVIVAAGNVDVIRATLHKDDGSAP